MNRAGNIFNVFIFVIFNIFIPVLKINIPPIMDTCPNISGVI